MQNHNTDDKFTMNFGAFDSDLFSGHMNAAMGGMGLGLKRSAHDAGLDREPLGLSSDDDNDLLKKDDKMNPSSSRDMVLHHQTNLDSTQNPQKTTSLLPNGKKTKGRVKIKMEFIDNKLRRYTTFSKRKTGIMKKAYELSTLTGTQVMLLVASETGHVYTFATRKLQPMITSEAGKALIQTCLNSPDPPAVTHHHHDQRMSATGFEETELTYAVNEEEHKDGSSYRDDYMGGGGSSSPSDCSSPPTPSTTPNCAQSSSGMGALVTQGLPIHLQHGLVLAPTVTDSTSETLANLTNQVNNASIITPLVVSVTKPPGSIVIKATPNLGTTSTFKPGGSMMMSGSGGSVMYATSGGLVYASPHAPMPEGATPLLLNLPSGIHVTSHHHDNNTNGSTGQLVSLPLALTSAALQQAAAGAMASAVASATSAGNSRSSSSSSSSHQGSGSQALPTDLSMHIKREKDTLSSSTHIKQEKRH